MPEVTLFCEDSFHEKFVGALLRRLAGEHGLTVGLRFLSARGGLPRLHGEFEDFLRDLSRDRAPLPDAVVVVVDANCLGYNGRKQQLDKVLLPYPQFAQLVTYAIPDPHIERWMLAYSQAFQSVFERGCTTPRLKCVKDEYKRLLRQEIKASAREAPLGGEEYAEDVVAAMNLGRMETAEPSLGLFLKYSKGLLNRWRKP